MPTSTTTSISNATSLIAKRLKIAAQPPWPSGKPSWHSSTLISASVRQPETSSHRTDSTVLTLTAPVVQLFVQGNLSGDHDICAVSAIVAECGGSAFRTAPLRSVVTHPFCSESDINKSLQATKASVVRQAALLRPPPTSV